MTVLSRRLPLALALMTTLAVESARAAAPLDDEVLARARASAAPLDDGVLEWTWLGVAGVRLRTKDAVVLVDPYLTRASFAETVLGPVRPDEALLAELLPEADAILIGHSHYDHLADAPAIAARTDALVLGSRTTCHLSRALGGPRCLTPREGRALVVDDGVRVTRLRARHGELGLLALLGGARSLHRSPAGRVHPLLDMPHGEPQAFVVDVDRPHAPSGPLRVFVHTSAGLAPPSDDTLAAIGADLAFVSASLAHLEERWPERITRAVKPGGTLVLIHYESLWATLSDDAPPNAGVDDLEQLVRELKAARPDLTVVVPRAFERVVVGAPTAALPDRAR